jgi:hypothetical protein
MVYVALIVVLLGGAVLGFWILLRDPPIKEDRGRGSCLVDDSGTIAWREESSDKIDIPGEEDRAAHRANDQAPSA